MKNIVTEFRWRGLLQNLSNGTEEQLTKESTSVYIGFDPTSDSLHVGSLVPIIMLKHLENFNHKPIVLIGGATGMIGDPSGKSEERNQLSSDELDKNYEGIRKTLRHFLTNATFVNNFDWMSKFSFLDFISQIGKMITVNYMMGKESVKTRLDKGGMSFTEFTYQLLQGYDFMHLYENYNCKVQMGGSDQYGNMTTGLELIRKKGGHGFALTCPLLVKSDGQKFGKSESGNIWLDKSKTSVYEFYQFWLNQSDQDSEHLIKTLTFMDQESILALIAEHKIDESKRLLQKRLASELTIFVHSEEDLQDVVNVSNVIFNRGIFDDNTNMQMLTEVVNDAKEVELSSGVTVLDFLTMSDFLTSNNERRRALNEGSVLINKIKVNIDTMITKSHFIKNHLLIQRGKKMSKVIVLTNA